MSKEVAIIKQGIKLADKIAEIQIVDTKSMEIANDHLSVAKAQLKAITEEKEKVTKPMNEALKAERARWKPAEDALDYVIKDIRKKMSAYQTEQDRIAREKEEKIAARVGEGKGKLKVETAVNKMNEIERAPEKIESEKGKLSFRTVKKFEVQDTGMLPPDYILPDLSAIRKAMLAGLELPGVKYWEEKEPINR